MPKRRVLVFTNSFRIGGSEGQALQLIKHLNRSLFEVHVACFDREGPLLDQLPLDVGEVPAFPLTGLANLNAVRQAAAFIAFLKKAKIQIVQTFDLYTNVFGLPLARLAGVPITVGSRRDHGVKRTVWQVRAERWSLRLAMRVVANAEAIKSRLVEDGTLPMERIIVIKNGLDLSRFSIPHHTLQHSGECDSQPVIFAVVANLRPEKGHLMFVRAAQIVASVCPDARFALIGDGPMRQKVLALIEGLGLREKFHLMGAVTNVPQALQKIDVVVSPSDTEGLPNAVLEGMAASRAVVATDAGGTRELVAEGVTGHLVPTGDVEGLASRMIALYKAPSIRESMGAHARKQVEQCHSAEYVASRFGLLYDELSVASGIGV
ncbi:MAG: glycosyltransferase [Nitrospira sp.]|jgi:glycosyltransferase involved in cell wall biosynthesis|nr:glycosyltransferase [Nitrospira sp.]